MLIAALLVLGAVLPAPLLGQARPGGQQPAPPGTRAVASSQGTVYYPVACDAWRELSPDNLRFFASPEAAKEAGYRPTQSRSCATPAGLSTLAPAPQDPDGSGVRRRESEAPATAAGVCRVTRILDGDTLDCAGGIRIRLLLIDAPEMAQSDLGLRSRLALEELLPPGDSAVVQLDVQERDRYGRLLAHLHRGDGTWVNRELVRRGYAVPLVYPPNVRGVEEVRAARDSARAEGRGLWESGGFACLPVAYRQGRCGG